MRRTMRKEDILFINSELRLVHIAELKPAKQG